MIREAYNLAFYSFGLSGLKEGHEPRIACRNRFLRHPSSGLQPHYKTLCQHCDHLCLELVQHSTSGTLWLHLALRCDRQHKNAQFRKDQLAIARKLTAVQIERSQARWGPGTSFSAIACYVVFAAHQVTGPAAVLLGRRPFAPIRNEPPQSVALKAAPSASALSRPNRQSSVPPTAHLSDAVPLRYFDIAHRPIAEGAHDL